MVITVVIMSALGRPACDTPAPAHSVSPVRTVRQDAPKQHGTALAACLYEDGNPDGLPCNWTDPDTGRVYQVDGSEYRN